MCRHVASFEGAGCACLAAASMCFDWIFTLVMGIYFQLIFLSYISEICFTLEGEMKMGGPVLLLRWPSCVCSFSPVLQMENLVLLFILVFPFPPLYLLSMERYIFIWLAIMELVDLGIIWKVMFNCNMEWKKDSSFQLLPCKNPESGKCCSETHLMLMGQKSRC